MSRLKKQERQKQLQEKLNITPFLTDEELATHFGVSVPTIRLDRLELGIPELRERIRVMATGQSHEMVEHVSYEVVGELIDVTEGHQALSMLRTTADMEDQFGYVEPQYLYAQANSLAKAVMGTTVCSAEVGNIKYKNPVGSGTNLVAKAEIIRRRGNKFFIWVIIRDKIKEVFRAKFIMESVENRVYIMKIAIDAMGGDFAPMETVLGSIEAVRANQHIEVVLVGDEQQIFDILEANNEAKNPRISVHHASQVIGMDEHPGQALRKKKDASVVVATSLVRDNRCDAVIAPGSTGAAVAAALFGLGRIKGIDRPVIATPMPTVSGITVMLDSGANSNCKPKHLVQGALMGSEYAKLLLGKENPTVGLLNIGEEATKGNDVVLATYPILEGMKTINFKGNIEGRDIPKGAVDVVVCDGFVGNVVLKFAEGLVTGLTQLVKDSIMAGSIFAKIGAMLVKPALKKMAKRLDHTENGGAPLLGVNGVFMIAHGSSKAKEIKTAIEIASDLVERKIIQHIRETMDIEGALKYDYDE